VSTAEALLQLLGSADLSSKRWVFEQYDHLILGNTVQPPGGDAAVIRVLDGPKGLAMTCDVTPRYCEADPYEGGKQAVAEAWRNITAVGGEPLAVTDNLNFGNPERPEIMGQLVACLEGIGDACRALDFPIVSGNVSLYNETNGRGILPTPTIGGVGLVPDVARTVGIAIRREGEAVIVIGETTGWLGQSTFLAEIAGREDGAPPPVDLAVEKRNGDFVRGLIRAGRVAACHDVSDGGLLVALAEMVMAGGVGLRLIGGAAGVPPHAFWFGEDQARYVLSVPSEGAAGILADARAAGVPALVLGTSVGDALILPDEPPNMVSRLKLRHEGFMPALMSPGQKAA
jgi:phosphoribosylformylglycinamidine (FGAM) synthase-like enzyme